MKYTYLLLATVLLCACSGSAETDPHAGHAHALEGKPHPMEEAAPLEAQAEHEEHEGEITLPQSQAEELGVEWAKVTAVPFSSVIHTSGRIEAAPGDEVSITAPVSGIVSFARGGFTEGQAVSKGTPLFNISSEELTDSNNASRVAAARATLTKAEANVTRLEELYKDRLTTSAELEDARVAMVEAQENYKNLTRNSSTKGRTVTSPAAGYVTTLAVRDGQYVNEGESLGTVSSNRTVVLRADVPGRYFGELSKIKSANFSTPYNANTYSTDELSGRLLSTTRTASNSYSVPVRFEIDNRGGFVAGMVVDVFLNSTPRAEVITVPLSALTEEQGAYYVYLKTCVDSYAKRNVRIGESDGRMIEIAAGLAPGETVVTRGAYFVRLASMSAVIPDGHNH